MLKIHDGIVEVYIRDLVRRSSKERGKLYHKVAERMGRENKPLGKFLGEMSEHYSSCRFNSYVSGFLDMYHLMERQRETEQLEKTVQKSVKFF